jgi:molybdopterin-containing oxidoreductase family iron-sulfur binding subunit
MGGKKNKNKAENTDIQQALEASRRDFLKKAGISGAAVLSGAAAVFAGYRHEKSKNKGNFVKVLTTDNKLVKVPAEEVEGYEPGLKVLQKRGREGIPGKKWVMIIDLSKCRNARKCIEACQSAHHLRPYEYHINTLVMQESVNTPAYFMPKPCQHCDNPPCVSVCPVDATFKRQDGVVLIDNERCIGCRFCMAACPYSARMFHWEEPLNAQADKDKEYDIELNVPQKKGTISKCLFSSDRLRENKLPYCVSACPNGVYYFGDENEDAVTNGTTKETVKLSELLKQNGGYRLMPELGTQPRVYYLPPKNRIFDFDKDKPKEEDLII